MTRPATALLAAAAVPLALVATAQPAEANHRHHRHHHHRHFGFFIGAPVGLSYAADRALYSCYWRRTWVWDGFGWRPRRVQVCE